MGPRYAGGTVMNELPYWQADAKFGGENVSVLYEGGEWTAKGEGTDVLLSHLQDEIARRVDAADFNPGIVAAWGDIFAESLRACAPVYGIDTNFDRVEDVPPDAVI